MWGVDDIKHDRKNASPFSWDTTLHCYVNKLMSYDTVRQNKQIDMKEKIQKL